MKSELYDLAEQLSAELTPELLEMATEQERMILNAQFEQLRVLMAVDDYGCYAEYVHGSTQWKWSKHNRYLCDKVQEFIEAETDNPYDILAVSMPPQHGKSMTITQTFPSWYMGKYPDRKVIIAAYNDKFAGDFGRKNRDKIREFGGDLFGIKIAREPNSVSNFELDNGIGACIAKGLMAGITGKPGDLVIIDDPFKNQAEANSIIIRDNVWDGWEGVIKTRLAANAKIIIIMTRWHEDDLVGRIEKSEPNLLTVINIPCEAEENDVLGRAPGDALFPEIGKDNAWLKGFKASYIGGEIDSGSQSKWYALYQGRPRILQGNMFKEGWFEFWFPRSMSEKPDPFRVRMEDGNMGGKDPKPLPLEFDEIIQSWDCTFKDEMTSDFVVGTIWGRRGIDYYLLDMMRRRMNVVDTMEAMQALTYRWPLARLKLVEDKANGPAVIQLLRNKVSGLVPIPANQSKAGRANATQSAFESGHVHIPHPVVHKWAQDVIHEFTSFPNATNDDIVDSCVHALNRFDNNTANQTRTGTSTNYVKQTGEGWKPRTFKPLHRVAKGRARVI